MDLNLKFIFFSLILGVFIHVIFIKKEEINSDTYPLS